MSTSSYLPSDVVGILGSPEVGRTILGHHLDEEGGQGGFLLDVTDVKCHKENFSGPIVVVVVGETCG